MLLMLQQPKTYSQIFTIAREVEREPQKKNQDKIQMKSVKRPSKLMEDENSDRPMDTPLAKQPLHARPQNIICRYCLKPRHLQHSHRKTYELCFVCGMGDNLESDCPFI